MAYKKIEPVWVCFSCAYERGSRVPKGHCFTVHTDVCGICGLTTKVTEPRDFGVTRSLLLVVPLEIRNRIRENDRKRKAKKPRMSEEERLAYKKITVESARNRKRLRRLEKKELSK